MGRSDRGTVDLLSALDAATDEFGRRLALVGERAWGDPTPCAGWDVHYLVAHVIGGNRFATLVLGGMTAVGCHRAGHVLTAARQRRDGGMVDDVGRRRPRPSPRTRRWCDRSTIRSARSPASEFLRFRVFDITLHAWDLARSIGAGEQLDAGLVEAVLDIVDDGPPGMGFGIEALGNVTVDADPQARLLDLTGRPAPAST